MNRPYQARRPATTFQFTVTAQRGTDESTGRVFRVQSTGFKRVRAAFESLGWTVIAIHRDAGDTNDASIREAFAQKGWIR